MQFYSLTTLLSLFLVLLHTVMAVVDITGRLIDTNMAALPNVRLSLNGEKYALSRTDGQFTFFNVGQGIYLLDVLSVEYTFSQCKLKVDENGQVTVVEYKYPGATRVPMAYPIVLTAGSRVEYFQIRQPFSLLGAITGNPLISIGVLFVGAVVMFPDLMKLDAEALEAAAAGTGETPTVEGQTSPTPSSSSAIKDAGIAAGGTK